MPSSLTWVRWSSDADVERVAQAVVTFHAASGLNVRVMLDRLSVTMECGS